MRSRVIYEIRSRNVRSVKAVVSLETGRVFFQNLHAGRSEKSRIVPSWPNEIAIIRTKTIKTFPRTPRKIGTSSFRIIRRQSRDTSRRSPISQLSFGDPVTSQRDRREQP